MYAENDRSRPWLPIIINITRHLFGNFYSNFYSTFGDNEGLKLHAFGAPGNFAQSLANAGIICISEGLTSKL